MNRNELKDIIFEAYVEVLREQEALETGTEELLRKFPTLHRTMVNLMTREFENFIEDIQWVAPKPTTFKIVLKNDQVFFLKWTGKGFEAQIGGKRYYLKNLPEFQQAVDKLSEYLKYTPSQTSGEEGFEDGGADDAGFGGTGGDFPGEEGGEDLGGEEGEEEVEFEEPGEEPEEEGPVG